MSVLLTVTPKVSKNLPMKVLSLVRLKAAQGAYQSIPSEKNQLRLAAALDTFKKHS